MQGRGAVKQQTITWASWSDHPQSVAWMNDFVVVQFNGIHG